VIESLKTKVISKWTALSVKKKIIAGVAVAIIIIAIIL
jgi:flagellar biosynthesis/type III secretory pathway M-ring protein FliF/YscJ